MPAPPSSSVKAANAASIAASKGKSGISSPATSSRTTTSTVTRSSAPNAAAAAASARLNSGNAGKPTPSGVGNQIGSSGRTSTASPIRNTPNAAAANANRMTAALRAGTTISGSGKSNLFGADQTFSKGVNLSSGDLIKGGYRNYQQPPAARPAGFGPLSGIQMATARMNPSISSLVAGDPQAVYGGGIPADAQNPTFATENYVKDYPTPRAPKDQARVPSVNSPTRLAAAGYRDYDPMSSITTGNGPTPVATNPPRSFPARPAVPQVASYDPLSSIQRPAERPVTVADVPQLPGGASTVRPGVNPSMADFDMTALTREPQPYDPRGPQVAAAQNPPRVFPGRPTAAPTRTTFTQSLLDKGFTGEGLSPAGGTPAPASSAPRIALASPNAAAQRAWNIQRARDAAPPQQVVDGSLYGEGPAFDNTIYGDAPQNRTKIQRMADALTGGIKKKTAGIEKWGNRINAALGGSPNGGTPMPTPPGESSRTMADSNIPERLQSLVAAAQSGDPAAQQALKQWFIWNQWEPGSRPGLV